MTAVRALRALVAASWATGLVGLALDLALEPTLPSDLQRFLYDEASAPLSTAETVGLALGAVALVAWAWGSVDLWRLRARGRRLVTLGVAIVLVVSPLFGPTVFSGWGSAFYDASNLLTGALVGWLYLPGSPPLRSGRS